MTVSFIVALAVLVIVAVVTARRWLQGGASGADRLWGAFHASATIVVARLGMVAASALEITAGLADLIGQPAVRDAIQGLVPPQYWPLVLLAFAAAAELARRRTL